MMCTNFSNLNRISDFPSIFSHIFSIVRQCIGFLSILLVAYEFSKLSNISFQIQKHYFVLYINIYTSGTGQNLSGRPGFEKYFSGKKSLRPPFLVEIKYSPLFYVSKTIILCFYFMFLTQMNTPASH